MKELNVFSRVLSCFSYSLPNPGSGIGGLAKDGVACEFTKA